MMMMMLMMMMIMTLMKLVNSATKFRHGMDKFYQPNSGLRSSRSLDEAIYTYIYILGHIYDMNGLEYVCIYIYRDACTISFEHFYICIYMYKSNMVEYVCIYIYIWFVNLYERFFKIGGSP